VVPVLILSAICVSAAFSMALRTATLTALQ
jgi:hypothetical protein